jgi:hypothetical protein
MYAENVCRSGLSILDEYGSGSSEDPDPDFGKI